MLWPMRITLNKRGDQCFPPFTPYHRLQALPARRQQHVNRIALTSSPEIAVCVRRRSFRGSAPWPPEATTRCQGTRRQHRPHRVRTGPEHPQPDGASGSRPAEWCILRRRQRPSSCPTRQQSAAGYGCKSRPLSRAIDTLRPIAIIHHGGSSCPLALARLSCADVCLRSGQLQQRKE